MGVLVPLPKSVDIYTLFGFKSTQWVPWEAVLRNLWSFASSIPLRDILRAPRHPQSRSDQRHQSAHVHSPTCKQKLDAPNQRTRTCRHTSAHMLTCIHAYEHVHIDTYAHAHAHARLSFLSPPRQMEWIQSRYPMNLIRFFPCSTEAHYLSSPVSSFIR